MPNDLTAKRNLLNARPESRPNLVLMRVQNRNAKN